MNCMVWELYLNKTVILKKEEKTHRIYIIGLLFKLACKMFSTVPGKPSVNITFDNNNN